MSSTDTTPCYIRYSLRGLGTFSGVLSMVFGVLNVVFHFGSILCVLLGVFQGLLGFLVAALEVAGGSVNICHCITLNKLPGSFTTWMEGRPEWVRALFYITAPLPIMVFCTTVWTFFGSGMVFLSGVAYGVAFWRRQGAVAPPGNNNNNSGNTPAAGGMFPKHTVVNNVGNVPAGPTVIDIRGGGSSSSRNPLAGNAGKNPLGNTPAGKKNNLEMEEERGMRYENLAVISGSTTVDRPFELSVMRNEGGCYENVVEVDLEGGDEGRGRRYGNVGGGRNSSEEFNC